MSALSADRGAAVGVREAVRPPPLAPPRLPPLPGAPPTGPVVFHLSPDADVPPGGLAGYVASEAGISEDDAAALIAFGAVYWCPVPPAPPAGHPDAAAAAARTDAGRARHGRGLHLAAPRRAGLGDAPPAGSYIRVHARPKLFPAAGGLSAEGWAARLVAAGPPVVRLAGGGGGGGGGSGRAPASSPLRWTILDKPAGVPSVPTVDNGLQHALAGAEAGLAALGVDVPPPPLPGPARQRVTKRPRPPSPAGGLPAGGSLAAAHRLDQAASGLLVIALDRTFVGEYAAAAAAGGVAKCYRAAVVPVPAAAAPPAAPPLGPLTHWAARSPAAAALAGPARTLMRGREAADRDADARCELVVLGRRALGGLAPAAAALLTPPGSAGPDAAPAPPVHELSILLRTGRTHQIRAQLAAVGWPILGDGLYDGSGPGGGGDPASPVCLQAARIEVRGPGVAALAGDGGGGAEGDTPPALPPSLAFDASPPWWRAAGDGGAGAAEWDGTGEWLDTWAGQQREE